MKIRKIVTMVFVALTALLVAFSGILKFAGDEKIVATLDKVGVLPYRFVLGAMEICFALFFLFKPTMRIGFILLTCYFSGALAVELSHNAPFSALLPLILVWVSAFMRDRSLFLAAPGADLVKV